MTLQEKINKLRVYLSNKLAGLWSKAVKDINRLLLKVLSDGKPLDLTGVDYIINELKTKQGELIGQVEKQQYKLSIGFGKPNLAPLAEILKEKELLRNNLLESYKKQIIKDGADLYKVSLSKPWREFIDSVQIGRKAPDEIRAVTLKTIESKFKKGIANAGLQPSLVKEFKQMKSFDPETNTFPLEIRPYKGTYRNYKPEFYADLVSITTANEANTLAQVEKAKEIGTDLIKYNKRGKNYSKMGDDVCAKIDGKVFSLNPNGTMVKGKKVAYVWSVVKKPYLTPHPYCRHTPTPIFEEDVKVSDIYAG